MQLAHVLHNVTLDVSSWCDAVVVLPVNLAAVEDCRHGTRLVLECFLVVEGSWDVATVKMRAAAVCEHQMARGNMRFSIVEMEERLFDRSYGL